MVRATTYEWATWHSVATSRGTPAVGQLDQQSRRDIGRPSSRGRFDLANNAAERAQWVHLCKPMYGVVSHSSIGSTLPQWVQTNGKQCMIILFGATVAQHASGMHHNKPDGLQTQSSTRVRNALSEPRHVHDLANETHYNNPTNPTSVANAFATPGRFIRECDCVNSSTNVSKTAQQLTALLPALAALRKQADCRSVWHKTILIHVPHRRSVREVLQ